MVQSISSSRTLVLPEFTSTTAGMLWPLCWPAKDPHDERMDFSLDISSWLLQIQDNAAIIEAFWEPNLPTDTFVLTETWVHDSIATVLATGGTAWFVYEITLHITSQIQQQVLSRTISLPVIPLYHVSDVHMTSGMVSGVAV